MSSIKICKWDTYQQYKDRNPTWVKLHKSMLTSRTWVLADNDSRALMIALMMLACMSDDGTIPNDPDYICRVAYLKKADIEPLLKLGFIELIQHDTEVYGSVQKSTLSVSVSVSESVSESNKIEKTKNENYSQEFLDFWSQYPKQRIGSKPDAWKSWKKTLKTGEIDEQGLLAVCLAYANSEEVRIGRAKGCAAWLNDERWRNDYSVRTIHAPAKHDYFRDTVLKAVQNAGRE